VFEKASAQVGVATVAALHHKYIAVGTDRGVVMVFDHFESLVVALGQGLGQGAGERNRPPQDARGAVTALALTDHGEHLLALAGHHSGHLAVWDVSNKVLIKVLTDSATTPITAVHAVKKGVLVVVHQCGAANMYTRTNLVLTTYWEKTGLLPGGGTIGESFRARSPPILASAYLCSNPHRPHASDAYSLLALATHQWTLVVALRPTVRVLRRFTHDEEEESTARPCVTWCALPSSTAEAAGGEGEWGGHPVLYLARGRQIQWYQTLPALTGTSDASDLPSLPMVFKKMGDFTGPDRLRSLHWLDERVLVGLTEREQLVVLDPVGGLPGGEAGVLLQAPSGSGGSAVAASPDALLLLGTELLVKVTARSWAERLDALVAQGQWIEALALGLDLYDGGNKGLGVRGKGIQRVLSARLLALLEEYLRLALGSDRYTTAAPDTQHLQLIGGVAIDLCLGLNRPDVLFRDIYTRFVNEGGASVFLELLEARILRGHLTHLGPETMQAFVEHYHRAGKLVQVEQCIVHMDVSCLDFQQVVTLCRQHALFSALFAVYNKGLADYATPLTEALTALSSTALSPARKDVMLDGAGRHRLACKVLLYVDCCLRGLAFPRGDIPSALGTAHPSKVAGIKASLLATLFATESSGSSSGDSALPAAYPWLRALLQIDTLQTLRTLRCAWVHTRCQKSTLRYYSHSTNKKRCMNDKVPLNMTPTPHTTGHRGLARVPT
jgi:hypothetical protein